MSTPRTRVRTAVIASSQVGRRLDNVLAGILKGAPRSLLYKLLRSGQVRVNGGRVKPDYRVALGDEVRIPPVTAHDDTAPVAIPAARLEQCHLAIVFEDERFIVLNKPSGMACHGGSGIRYGVIEVMRALRPQLERLDLGHRLDRETSGCLVLTKDLPALQEFHAAVRSRETQKEYAALLCGRVPHDLREIDATLSINRDAHGERRTAVTAIGKDARTLITSASACGPHTLARLRLITGRMHQIRAHARHIGHPVGGDREYGDPDFNRALKALGLQRLFLHAERIAVSHGTVNLDVSAPLPAELVEVCARLEVTC